MPKLKSSNIGLGGGTVTGVTVPLYQGERASVNWNGSYAYSSMDSWVQGYDVKDVFGVNYSKWDIVSINVKGLGVGFNFSLSYDPQANAFSGALDVGAIIRGAGDFTFDFDDASLDFDGKVYGSLSSGLGVGVLSYGAGVGYELKYDPFEEGVILSGSFDAINMGINGIYVVATPEELKALNNSRLVDEYWSWDGEIIIQSLYDPGLDPINTELRSTGSFPYDPSLDPLNTELRALGFTPSGLIPPTYFDASNLPGTTVGLMDYDQYFNQGGLDFSGVAGSLAANIAGLGYASGLAASVGGFSSDAAKVYDPGATSNDTFTTSDVMNAYNNGGYSGSGSSSSGSYSSSSSSSGGSGSDYIDSQFSSSFSSNSYYTGSGYSSSGYASDSTFGNNSGSGYSATNYAAGSYAASNASASASASSDPFANPTPYTGYDPSSSYSTSVGGSWSYFPVLLDLDGDGFDITPLTSSNFFFDVNDDGHQQRTAWAGAGDAILAYDADGDGQITPSNRARKYNFIHSGRRIIHASLLSVVSINACSLST